MKPTPLVGQTIYAIETRNYGKRELSLSPMTVTKVRRKLFTAIFEHHGMEVVFRLEDWMHNNLKYPPDWKAYTSEQDWKDEKEVAELWDQIEAFFRYSSSSLSLDQLRAIRAILPIKL